MTLLEFVVVGAPVSQQTHNRPSLQRWKQKVRAEAAKAWSLPPVTTELRFVVTHFYTRLRRPMDDDNLLKPLRDALIGLVYNDDAQITDSASRQSSLDLPFNLDEAPALLIEALTLGIGFVYIRVEDAPDHRQLLR
jgi:hypothetical protein